jgi:hypothetical protein
VSGRSDPVVAAVETLVTGKWNNFPPTVDSLPLSLHTVAELLLDKAQASHTARPAPNSVGGPTSEVDLLWVVNSA